MIIRNFNDFASIAFVVVISMVFVFGFLGVKIPVVVEYQDIEQVKSSYEGKISEFREDLRQCLSERMNPINIGAFLVAIISFPSALVLGMVVYFQHRDIRRLEAIKLKKKR